MTVKILAVLLLLACCAIAQDSAPEKSPSLQKPITQSYPASHFGFPEKGDTRRFLFTLNELDNGRKINTRTVEVLAREGQSNDLKTGSRIAIPNGPTGFQYIDVGLNLHLRYALRDDKTWTSPSYLKCPAWPRNLSRTFTPSYRLHCVKSNLK